MRHLGVLLMSLWASGCMSMDVFLYAPLRAPDDADLMALATDIPMDMRQEVRIPSADGVAVDTYLLTHTEEDGSNRFRHPTWILYCHGNGENIRIYARRAQALWRLGYSVAIFDYRGYGKTPGHPSEEGIYRDARAVLDYLQDNLSAANRLAVYGYSLGTAVGVQLASEQALPALLLEAPFASVERLVRDNEGLEVPRTWYTDAQMDTVGKIAMHRGALLVMHGEADNFIQAAYGRQISAAAAQTASPNLLWTPAHADHATVPCIPGPKDVASETCPQGFDPTYLDLVQTFIDTAIPVTQTPS